jgi:hypothetical protein
MLTPEQIRAIAGNPPPGVPVSAPAPQPQPQIDLTNVGTVQHEGEAPRAALKDQFGKFFSVPQEQVETALANDPTLAPASQQEFEHHKYLKTLSPLAAAGKQLAASAVRGTGWVANTALAGANLLGADVKPVTTEEYRAGGAALWAALNGDDMQEAWDQSVAAHRDENEAFPTLMSATRTVGDIAGMAAGGGFLGAGAAAKGAAAAGLGKAAQVGVGLGAEALEGAVQGGLAEYDTADTPTRERVLAAMGMGALLSAGIGGGVRLAGKAVDAGASAVAQRMPDTKLMRRVFGQPELSVEGFEGLLAQGLSPEEALAKTLGKELPAAAPTEPLVALDGTVVMPKPKATDLQIRDAIKTIEDTVAARAERASPRITADNFDRIKAEDITDLGAAANRKSIEEGASRSIRRDMDAVLNNSFEATEQIRAMPLKRELVHANLAANGLADNADSFAAVQNRFQQIRQRLGTTVAELGGNLEKPVKKALEDQLYVLEKAEAAIGIRPKFTSGVANEVAEETGQKTVSDAYIAADTLRREMYARRSSLESQMNKTASARVRDQSKALFEAVDQEYHGLAETLFDESLFGTQGAVQNRVNHAWVGAIPENKLALRNFTSEVGEHYGHTKYGADPDKIRSYLGSLGRESLKNENFARWLDTQDELMAGALEGYGKALSPKSLKLMEDTRAAIGRLRGTLAKSEDLMIRSADGAQALGDTAATQGMLSSLGGSLVGGPLGGAAASALAGASLGGARGAAVGAVAGLVPGLGYANAIRLAQKTRAFAQATDSAVVDSIASFLETSTGLTKRGATLPRLAGAKVPRLLPEGISPAAAAILGRRKPEVDDDEDDGERKPMAPPKPERRAPGPPIASPPRNDADQREAQRSRQQTFTARRDFLASMTPERVMASAGTAFGPMAATMPKLSSALTDGYSQKISQLLQDWPKTLSNALVPSRKSDRASSDQIAQSEAMWTATFQPMSIFKDFKRGMVDYDAVTYLRKQWPELVQTAQMATIDLLQQLPADAPVPDNRVTQLDLFLGASGALDDTLTPSFLKTMQQMGEYAAAQEAADKARPPANQANFAEQYATPNTRRMTA